MGLESQLESHTCGVCEGRNAQWLLSLRDGGQVLAVGVVPDQPHLGVVAGGGEVECLADSWNTGAHLKVGKPGRMHNQAVAQRLNS